MQLWSLARQPLLTEKRGTHIHRQDLAARRGQGWALYCRLGLLRDLGKRLHITKPQVSHQEMSYISAQGAWLSSTHLCRLGQHFQDSSHA